MLFGLEPAHAGLLLATLAGLAVPIGAALARAEGLLPRWLETELQYSVMAFGGSALFSAIALVLMPEAIHRAPPAMVLQCFLAGGLVF